MDGSKLRTAGVILIAGGLLTWGAMRGRPGTGRADSHAHHSTLAAAPAASPTDADEAASGRDNTHAVDDMAQAATNFWSALSPEEQAKAHYDMKDDERMDWHFIPKPRKGLAYKDMTPDQRDLAQALLASGLSSRGFRQAVTIMSLDQILKEMENGKGPLRDPENYYFTVFGTPGPAETWGWRVEGHHLSFNFTISDGKAVAGPTFMGSNPGEVRQGPRKGLRILGATEDMGRALIKSFSEEERKAAIISAEAPKEVITGNSRKADPGPPVGVPESKMSPEQQKQLMAIVKEFACRLHPELAAQDLEKIRQAGWDKVYFAWAGSLEPGQKHYYRIHGPTFLLEYDNTQNDANHIHTVWRDAANDFGEDLLRRHYEQHHAEAEKAAPGGGK